MVVLGFFEAFFFVVSLFVLFFLPKGKAVLGGVRGRLENLLRFSYNGTMGGINASLIVGRDNAQPILGGRIIPGRWEDFS